MLVKTFIIFKKEERFYTQRMTNNEKKFILLWKLVNHYRR